MPDSPGADRNLLFGVLALQMNFVRRADLLAAMNAWATDRSKPLDQVLVDRGCLSAEQRQALDAVLALHLRTHGDDAERSLASLTESREVAAISTLAGDVVGLDLPPRKSDADCRYRILKSHARGGLGEVFIAEEVDLHREVALKEIKSERAHDAASRHRFVLEAEITGRLEHPGVVPVYGFGVHPDGRPYYAMRFIRGESLKDAIEQHHAGNSRWTFRELLTRFVAVCNAIAYAHSRGVIHRDIKPANVMLGKFGETLVVDWGLAKTVISNQSSVISDEESSSILITDHCSLITHAGGVMGTPAYMSPEQAEGRADELGPASDIYSLGATMYNLLTGRKAFEASDTASVLEGVKCGAFPPPRQVNPEVPPALDAVCRKAMALRPGDRYESALALAADVEHWLADEPVSAYAEPWRGRAARWARHHRSAVASAAVLLISAVVALSVTTLLVWREQRQTAAAKAGAERNYQLARDLSFSGIDLIAASEAEFATTPARQESRKDVLTAAARAFDVHRKHDPNDVDLRLKAAQVYRYAANAHRLDGEDADAADQYRKAADLYETLVGQFPSEALHRVNLSATLRDFSKVRADAGKLREAGDLLTRAVQLADGLRAEHPGRTEYRRLLGMALLDLSSVQFDRGLLEEAGASARAAAEIFQELLGPPAGRRKPYDPLLLAGALTFVAQVERESAKIDDAVKTHATAMQTLQPLLPKPPPGVNVVDVDHFAAACRLEQCRTWTKVPSKRESTETNLGLVIGRWQKLSADFARVPMYQFALADALRVRGEFRVAHGRDVEARADLEAARKLLEARVDKPPRRPDARAQLGRIYLDLARLARAAGDGAAADDFLTVAQSNLSEATKESPDNAQYKAWLAELSPR